MISTWLMPKLNFREHDVASFLLRKYGLNSWQLEVQACKKVQFKKSRCSMQAIATQLFIYENSLLSCLFYGNAKSSINIVIFWKMPVNYPSMFRQIWDYSFITHSLKCHHVQFKPLTLMSWMFEMSAWIMFSWCQAFYLAIQGNRKICLVSLMCIRNNKLKKFMFPTGRM